MNVVDSLIVTLGLDPSGFTKGQKDAAAAQAKLTQDSVAKAKQIEDANAKAGESVAALGRKFLGLYVLLTAGKGVQQFVSEITAADAALGRTAKNLDMSGRNLSAWQNAATVAGGSAEGITGTLRGLTSEMQKAALTGQSSIIPVFRALGINLADAKGKARDAGDVLVDLNRKAQGMDPARFTELAHMAGIDDGTIALLEKTTAEFDKLRAEQVKYAATAEDIDAAQKRQSGWRQLLITSSSLGRTILTSLTPAITAAMTGVQRWADANQNFIKTKVVEYAERFATWIKSVDWADVAAKVGVFVTNVSGIAGAVAGVLGGVDADSPLSKALTALGVLAGVTLVSRFASLTKAITSMGAVALPAWFLRMAGLPGAMLAAGGAAGAMNVGHTDEYGRDAGTWGGDAPAKDGDPQPVPRPTITFGTMWDWLKGKMGANSTQLGEDGNVLHRNDETPATRPATENQQSGFWASLKRLVGFGDDAKVKDGIEDTAKATGEMRDLMKAQKDGLHDATSGIAPIGASGGAIPNMRYGPGGHTPGSTSAGGGEGGSRSWRNNNPGNISYGKWAKAHGADGSDGRFAHFPSYEAGRKAQEDLWFNSDLYKGKTLAGAVTLWSPPSENDTAGLIKRYAAAAGVDPNTPLSQLTPAQRSKMLDAQQAAEGWKAGSRTNNVSGLGSTGTGDVVDRAQGMVGLREGEAAKALKHIMHAGEWCADFVNGTIEANGGKGSGSAMARSFMNWGKAVGIGDVKRGDVAVLNNGGHVGFFTGERSKDGRLGVIAGNTRDGHGGHDVEHYFVDPRSVYGARRGESGQAPPVTVDHAVRRALGAIAHANKLTHHNDNHPVPITMGDRTADNIGKRTFGRYLDYAKKHQGEMPHAHAAGHAAALDRMTRMAASGGGHSVHHTVNHMDTRIGEMNVHPKGDAKQFAGEFHGMVSDRARRGDVVQANGALA